MTGWVPGQMGLRAGLVVAPVAALGLAAPAGGRPAPGWVLVVVVVSSLVWAARPEGPGGVVALTAVLGWWARSVPDLSAWTLPAAALLSLAHCAALVASHGPADLVPARGVLLVWGRRALLLSLAALPVWLAGSLLVAGRQPAPVWVWPVAAALVVLGGLAVASRTVERAG